MGYFKKKEKKTFEFVTRIDACCKRHIDQTSLGGWRFSGSNFELNQMNDNTLATEQPRS